MSKKNKIIRCPHCGYEYVPSEIFYPDTILGKAKDIIRDESGHIEFYLGDKPMYVEEYICDNCEKSFIVQADINFITSTDSIDFDSDFKTSIYENRIILDENDDNKVELF